MRQLPRLPTAQTNGSPVDPLDLFGQGRKCRAGMPRDPDSLATPPDDLHLDFDDGGIVRLATLLPIPALLREKGVDPTELLADVGLAAATFDDAENQMPFRTGGLLLQRCAEVTGMPALRSAGRATIRHRESRPRRHADASFALPSTRRCEA